MARQAYAITAGDLPIAIGYLRRKLRLEPFWLQDDQAGEEFSLHCRDAVTLNAWCQRWLDQSRWRQLKAAIRPARHRQRRQSGQGPNIHVSLSRTAGLVLRDLAKRDGVTLSEFIIRYHYQDWLHSDDTDTKAA